MKSSITNFISFIIMSVFVCILAFISYEISIREKVLLKRMDNCDYYDRAYKNIDSKLDDFIINEDIKRSYSDYITKDLVTKDINLLISQSYEKKPSISRYNDFYKIIEKYTQDDDVKKVYSNKINDIYSSNLVPTQELSLINIFYMSTSSVIFIVISFMTLCIGLVFLLFFINKNLNFIKPILVGVSVLCVIPFVVKLLGLFNGFIYTNVYYTDFLLGIIDGIVNVMFIISIVITFILTVKHFVDTKVNN